MNQELKFEKSIKLILDNFKPHSSKFISRICKALKINLIFLPTKSPHLNPLKQVWIPIKAEIRMLYIQNQAHLEQEL